MRRFYCFLLLAGMCSCQGITHSNEIDGFITKYGQENFDVFKGLSISQRTSNRGQVVYMVGSAEGNLPVYTVTFDLSSLRVSSVNSDLLRERQINTYLTPEKIQTVISEIRRYGFYGISVDSAGIVAVNPFEVDTPPILLRLPAATGEPEVGTGLFMTCIKTIGILIGLNKGCGYE